MEKRRFGRSEHLSTVAIFGSYAVAKCDQPAADNAIADVMKYGVNHIDIAPSYGEAELRLAPWMREHRKEFFLGCKTRERTKEGAKAELIRSLKRLNSNYFDLYQIHAVKSLEDLDQATASGGALEALIEAKKEGLINYIGITGHRFPVPTVLIEALKRYDFDSVLFPLNFIQMANPIYREETQKLLTMCRKKDVGVMVIKSIAISPFGQIQEKISDTLYYEPITDAEHMQKAINFVLSLDITGICTAGDLKLLPRVLEACENFSPLSESDQAVMIEDGKNYQLLFPPN